MSWAPPARTPVRPRIGLLSLAGLAAIVACGEARTPNPTAPLSTTETFTVSSSEIYELIRLPGDNGYAVGINNQGVVVGAAVRDGYRRAVYWTVDEAGTVTGPIELGLPGEVVDQYALRVNEGGHVIAKDRAASTSKGFIYDVAADHLVSLSVPSGSWAVEPWSINESSVVTGAAYYDDAEGNTSVRAVVWLTPFDPSVQPIVLPLPDSHVASCSIVVPINDSGVVFGYSEAEDGTCGLVRWLLNADGTVSGPDIVGPDGFYGRQMNNSDRIPGQVGSYPDIQPVVREPDGLLTALSPLADDPQAAAVAINDPTLDRPVQAAGISDIWGDEETAVIWSFASDGTPSDPMALPLDEDDMSSRASLLNAHGWVTGRIEAPTKPGPPGDRGGPTAALWIPSGEDGGSADDGGDCVPKGPNGNNCK